VSVTGEVKKVGRSKVFWFFMGILAGGTVLAAPVAMGWAWFRRTVLKKP
jgi:hypothetical protein